MAAQKGETTSPEEQTVTNRVAALEPSTGSLTVNVEMKKATEYSKESKSVSAYLKVALPDDALIGEEGSYGLHNEFRETVERVSREMLALCEVACATQHGLAVTSDEAGVVRVLGLFPGGTSTPAAVAPSGATGGPFSAPAAAPAPAAPVPAAAPQAPQAPAPNGGGFTPGGGGGGQRTTNNPNAWSNQTPEHQKRLAEVIEAYCATGEKPEGTFYDNMGPDARYKGFKVGEVNIGAKTVQGNPLFGAAAKQYIANCVAAGVVIG